jgi:hypothetical protein
MIELSFTAQCVDGEGQPVDAKPTLQRYDWERGQWVAFDQLLRRAKVKAQPSIDGGAWRLTVAAERASVAEMVDLLGTFRLYDATAPGRILGGTADVTMGKEAVAIDFARVVIGPPAADATPAMTQKMADLSAQLAEAKTARDTMETGLSNERRAAQSTLSAAVEAAKIAAMEEGAAATRAEMEAQHTLAINDVQAKYDALLSQHAVLQSTAMDPPAELAALRIQAADLQASAKVAAAERDVLRSQITEAKPTRDVIANVSQNIAAAASQLETNAAAMGGFTLGRTTITMRGILSEGGAAMHLPSSIHTISEGALSEFSFELNPITRTANPGEVMVPALLGLTRSGVEMALRDAGLKPLFSAAPAPSAAHHGRTFRQLPEAGVIMPRGADILAVIGEEGSKP